jgi:hypothetical protein
MPGVRRLPSPERFNITGGMKSKLLFAASALALLVWLASIALFMEMYDVKPQTWGPQGVEFAEWHQAWAARRDLYVGVGMCSFLVTIVFAVAGALWWKRRLITHSTGRAISEPLIENLNLSALCARPVNSSVGRNEVLDSC